MRQVNNLPAVRDPAPSRWAYRLHRLWLTPMFWRVLRVGAPVAGVALAVYWVLGSEARRDEISVALQEAWRAVEERPEFMLNAMAVDGASLEVAEAVRSAVVIDFPVSSFDLKLPEIRAEIEKIDSVARARVHVRPGGILQVDVEERVAALLWRGPDGLVTLDAEGHRVRAVTYRAERGDLPLIVGEGADEAVTEAQMIFEAAEPLKDRLRGLHRRGARRWDVVLDRNQRILLPEVAPVQMLERLIALDKAQDVLERDITHIDLRNPRRPTLRLAEQAVEELRRIRGLDLGGQTE